MICVSIAEPDLEKCINVLQGLELAEIRLDKTPNDSQTIKEIFSQKIKLIATCRPENLTDAERKRILLNAINFGASFVDIEVDASDEYKKEIINMAKAKNCKVIVSYHDYKKTPSEAELSQIVNWCFQSGADIAKIACLVNTNRDNARLLGLIDSEKKIIVIGMGGKGKITRIVAPILGSPFTFACLEKGKETAEGQMTKSEIQEILGKLGIE
ncbi:MAG: type I 3-dehydroquinate dehydratase [Candidatus Micrarchaeota archaeon]